MIGCGFGCCTVKGGVSRKLKKKRACFRILNGWATGSVLVQYKRGRELKTGLG